LKCIILENINFIILGTNSSVISISTTTRKSRTPTNLLGGILSPDDQCKALYPDGSFCRSNINVMCSMLACRQSYSDRTCYLYSSNNLIIYLGSKSID
jgi:hypothetical protein